ncbi:MAG: hypothetical protein AABX75_00755 [Nanoarchaeota archaeon]
MNAETIRTEICNGNYACAIRVAGEASGQPGMVLIEIHSGWNSTPISLTVAKSQLEKVLETAELARAGPKRDVAFFKSLSLSELIAPEPVVEMGMPHQYASQKERYAPGKPVDVGALGVDVVR